MTTMAAKPRLYVLGPLASLPAFKGTADEIAKEAIRRASSSVFASHELLTNVREHEPSVQKKQPQGWYGQVRVFARNPDAPDLYQPGHVRHLTHSRAWEEPLMTLMKDVPMPGRVRATVIQPRLQEMMPMTRAERMGVWREAAAERGKVFDEYITALQDRDAKANERVTELVEAFRRNDANVASEPVVTPPESYFRKNSILSPQEYEDFFMRIVAEKNDGAHYIGQPWSQGYVQDPEGRVRRGKITAMMFHAMKDARDYTPPPVGRVGQNRKVREVRKRGGF